MRIKYPTAHLAPQKNGNRDWNIGHVSPQDATQESFDGAFLDQHGNGIALDDVAPSRPKQIAQRLWGWLFGRSE